MEQDPTSPTGINDPHGTPEGRRAISRKADAALQLRLAGTDPEQIAFALGYPDGAAVQRIIEQALEKQLAEDPKMKARMRELTSRRLEQLLRSTWGKANDPTHPEHLVAVGKAKEVIADHVKLLGLAAPSEVVISSPDTATIESWVASITGGKGPAALPEGDVLDVDPDDLDDDPEWTEDEVG